MENAGYIFTAFAAVWLAVFVYLIVLSSRQRRLRQEIESLKGPLKESGVKQSP
jgi:CcmD family protein